jgi:hypothetical protein
MALRKLWIYFTLNFVEVVQTYFDLTVEKKILDDFNNLATIGEKMLHMRPMT